MERELPSREKPRTLIELPIAMLSRTERLLPMSEIPYTLQDEPRRTSERIEIADPKLIMSRQDTAEPIRDSPYMEREDPMRKKLLVDKELPIIM
mmetsp:Transcript_12991/g.31740  ORF Transcript_12991/g.31740 Transcript_12991/m.31740 type:complete len:94 (-) Transcript_12991:75-356(-)